MSRYREIRSLPGEQAERMLERLRERRPDPVPPRREVMICGHTKDQAVYDPIMCRHRAWAPKTHTDDCVQVCATCSGMPLPEAPGGSP